MAFRPSFNFLNERLALLAVVQVCPAEILRQSTTRANKNGFPGRTFRVGSEYELEADTNLLDKREKSKTDSQCFWLALLARFESVQLRYCDSRQLVQKKWLPGTDSNRRQGD